MSNSLGDTGPGHPSGPASGTPPGHPAPPAAARVARSGWRDPRLWIGVLLVAGSVVLGARVLAAADDTVAVWAAVEDTGGGAALTADDVVAVRVRFADAEELDRYYPADEDLPPDVVLLRGVGAGELLPRAAVGAADDARTVRVPVDVAPHAVPPAVDAGSVVQVWIGPGSGQDGGEGRRDDGDDRSDRRDLRPALASAVVVAAPPPEQTIASTGRRQLVLAVDEDLVGEFLAVLDGAQDRTVRIVVLRA